MSKMFETWSNLHRRRVVARRWNYSLTVGALAAEAICVYVANLDVAFGVPALWLITAMGFGGGAVLIATLHRDL